MHRLLLPLCFVAACNCEGAAFRDVAEEISIDPESLDFGDLRLGTHADQRVRIVLNGSGPIMVASPVADPPLSPFTVVFVSAALEGDSSTSATITFAPVVDGDFAATLRFAVDPAVGETTALVLSVKGRGVSRCTDRDTDGYGSGCDLGPDCDDSRAEVNPGATEICGNGLDDDCKPATSDICAPGCEDADHDTYGDHCAPGRDCDDTRGSVHPGATEICGNGLDDDCDPSTSDTCPVPCDDADHDGYGERCTPGPDCNDFEPSIHPGAPERCGNAFDDDCDPSTPDTCPVTCGDDGCTNGCADGAREAFLDVARYPFIAGCAGGFQVPGVYPTVPPSCGRRAGDDSTNPSGSGCNLEDLCAPGWHVCRHPAEVAAKSPDACRGSDGIADSFWATRQSGPGCGQCAIGTDTSKLCTGLNCASDCYPTETQTNDVFGCGTVGSTPASTCGPLDRFSGNACNSLPAPWNCSNSDGADEAMRVVKPGPEHGGVLCCVD